MCRMHIIPQFTHYQQQAYRISTARQCNYMLLICIKQIMLGYICPNLIQHTVLSLSGIPLPDDICLLDGLQVDAADVVCAPCVRIVPQR